MDFSKKLERLNKKIFKIDSLQEMLANLSCSEEETKNLEKLFTQIDKSFEAYEDKVLQAERSLALSSEELSESNKNLFIVNQTINALLNSLDEGFVVFDKEGICDNISSRAAQNHFGVDFGNGTHNIIPKLSSNLLSEQSIKDWLEITFSGAFDFESIQNLGPEKLDLEDKYIQLNYRPITNQSGNIQKLIAITNDITSEINAKEEADRQKSAALTVLEISKSPDQFVQFLEYFDKVMTELKQQLPESGWDHTSEVVLKRTYHTLKGAAGVFHLRSLIDDIHRIETTIGSETEEVEKKRAVVYESISQFKEYRKRIDKDFGIILDTLRQNNADIFQVRKSNLIQVWSYFRESNVESQYLNFFKSRLLLTDFFDFLTPMQSMIENLSEKLNKDVELSWGVGRVYVNRAPYKGFASAINHVFRNMIDHGLEDPEEREKVGKPKKGLIKVHTEATSGKKRPFLVLRIQDDGRGIDPEKIRQKIKGTKLETKYLDLDNDNIINAIFEPDFSTKSEITELSGRGVGLNAVKNEVDKIGGYSKVFSKIGEGTTFEFYLPLFDHINIEEEVQKKVA